MKKGSVALILLAVLVLAGALFIFSDDIARITGWNIFEEKGFLIYNASDFLQNESLSHKYIVNSQGKLISTQEELEAALTSGEIQIFKDGELISIPQYNNPIGSLNITGCYGGYIDKGYGGDALVYDASFVVPPMIYSYPFAEYSLSIAGKTAKISYVSNSSYIDLVGRDFYIRDNHALSGPGNCAFAALDKPCLPLEFLRLGDFLECNDFPEDSYQRKGNITEGWRVELFNYRVVLYNSSSILRKGEIALDPVSGKIYLAESYLRDHSEFNSTYWEEYPDPAVALSRWCCLGSNCNTTGYESSYLGACASVTDSSSTYFDPNYNEATTTLKCFEDLPNDDWCRFVAKGVPLFNVSYSYVDFPVYEVSNCTDINEPGYYVLTNNITFDGYYCIYINSSNVTLDGNGNSLLYSGENKLVYSIWTEGVENIKIQNFAGISSNKYNPYPGTYASTSVFLSGVRNSEVSNNKFVDSFRSISLEQGPVNISVLQNQFYNNFEAIHAWVLNNSVISDNYVDGSNDQGISIEGGYGTLVENNVVIGKRGLGLSRETGDIEILSNSFSVLEDSNLAIEVSGEASLPYLLGYSNSFGSVYWNLSEFDNVSVQGNLTFPGEILIQNNSVSFNFSVDPELNASTVVSFFGLAFNNPKIHRNGEFCSECTLILYDGVDASFFVEDFGEYSLVEGPYCGNGVADEGETCSNCPSDVGACPSTTSGGGSGGSRGGSSGGNATFYWDYNELVLDKERIIFPIAEYRVNINPFRNGKEWYSLRFSLIAGNKIRFSLQGLSYLKQFELFEGDEKEIDLDDDGYLDLYFDVISLEEDRAVIRVMAIHKQVEGFGADISSKTGEEQEIKEPVKDKIEIEWFPIIFGLIIVVLIGVMITLLVKSGKKSSISMNKKK